MSPKFKKMVDDNLPIQFRKPLTSFAPSAAITTPLTEALDHFESNLLQSERGSGFPQPDLYDKHCINKYSFPKGLTTYARG